MSSRADFYQLVPRSMPGGAVQWIVWKNHTILRTEGSHNDGRDTLIGLADAFNARTAETRGVKRVEVIDREEHGYSLGIPRNV